MTLFLFEWSNSLTISYPSTAPCFVATFDNFSHSTGLLPSSFLKCLLHNGVHKSNCFEFAAESVKPELPSSVIFGPIDKTIIDDNHL